MRVKIHIPENELRELRRRGWSYPRIARRYGVSKRTIIRRFAEMGAIKKEKANMTFAMRLENAARVAPGGYFRAELIRLASMVRAGVSDAEKKRAIRSSLASGAVAVVEIAEETRLSREETERLLAEMESDGVVGSRERGGVQNRGRKKKLHYFLRELTPEKK